MMCIDESALGISVWVPISCVCTQSLTRLSEHSTQYSGIKKQVNKYFRNAHWIVKISISEPKCINKNNGGGTDTFDDKAVS